VSSLDSGLRYVIRSGFRRGVKGQWAWIVVGSAAWMILRARKSSDQVVYRTLLKAGESLVVTTGRPDDPA
jgi:hypothetical protein